MVGAVNQHGGIAVALIKLARRFGSQYLIKTHIVELSKHCVAGFSVGEPGG